MRIGTVNLNQAISETTMSIRITGGRRLAVRMRVAAAFMTIAGWIAGPRTEVTVELGE